MNENKYKHTYLTEVVVRLDFTAPLEKLAKLFPDELTKIISPIFPISEPRQYIGTDLIITKTIQKKKSSPGTDWLFHGVEKDKTLTLAKDNINIIYKKYESFEKLKENFIPILDKLFNIYDDLQGRRLGLRYINNIQIKEGEALSWDGYINPKLLSMLDFPDNAAAISRAFNNLSFNYGDSLLTFQYGLYNADFPAPVRKRNFVLDFDAYYQGPQNFDDIRRNIDLFHNNIQALFERSISDKLRHKMGANTDG